MNEKTTRAYDCRRALKQFGASVRNSVKFGKILDLELVRHVIFSLLDFR